MVRQAKGTDRAGLWHYKEQLRARRFLLRGLANVRAEFMMLATAFNLRVLWRAWKAHQSQGPAELSLANPPARM